MDKAVQSVKRLYLRLKYYRYGWRGNYSSWKEVQSACAGYNAANILERIKASTLKVKNGEAVYERDAMLFSKIEYSWPLLANLLWIASLHEHHLSVLDFGGSLGSTYFQNRFYLKTLKQLTWSVVEQKDFVTAGKKEIAGDQLSFFDTPDEALRQKGRHTVLLLSCVLPYIEKPFELLKELAAKEIEYIIIDNTYFNNKPASRLTLQKVPPVYYDAAYPAWFLDYRKVINTLNEKYEVITEYTNDQILYLQGEKITYQGFVMKLKNHR